TSTWRVSLRQNGALGSIVPFERSAMVDLLSASQMQRITPLNLERPLTCRACRCGSLVPPDHRANVQRDRDMETTWCSEFSRLQQSLASFGRDKTVFQPRGSMATMSVASCNDGKDSKQQGRRP